MVRTVVQTRPIGLCPDALQLEFKVMNITVSIPDKFMPPPSPGVDFSREVLEAYAIESYRQERMSLGQVAELLELSISETHAFLKDHNVRLNYGPEDLERDSKTIDLFLKK